MPMARPSYRGHVGVVLPLGFECAVFGLGLQRLEV